MAKADFLKEKAEAFFEDAQYDISRQKWFAAAFHLEQTCQLYLKYYLFLKIKDFPKIHELNGLIREVGRVYKKEKKIKEFLKDNASVISDLNQAYITARYLPVEFNQENVGKMFQFTKKLIKLLKSFYEKRINSH